MGGVAAVLRCWSHHQWKWYCQVFWRILRPRALVGHRQYHNHTFWGCCAILVYGYQGADLGKGPSSAFIVGYEFQDSWTTANSSAAQGFSPLKTEKFQVQLADFFRFEGPVLANLPSSCTSVPFSRHDRHITNPTGITGTSFCSVYHPVAAAGTSNVSIRPCRVVRICQNT